MTGELHQVHIDALQLLQPQELQSVSNHMSADVMIDELPQVHNNALQLQQPQALLHYSNHASIMFTYRLM